MSKQDELDHQKSDLLADLNATTTVMEEVWKYHPDNPNKLDVVDQYNLLKRIQSDIEKELADLGK